jgi:hypothetical protein
MILQKIRRKEEKNQQNLIKNLKENQKQKIYVITKKMDIIQ